MKKLFFRLCSAGLAAAMALTLAVPALAAGSGASNAPADDFFRPVFSDVPADAWCAPAVADVLDRGLMNGVGGGRFQPDGTLTRAMLVTVLWRLAGEPAAGADLPFRDVPADTWYTQAVRWAAENDVVEGMTADTFAPDSPITREQMAVIFHRWAQGQGMDVTVRQPLDQRETNQVSPWAAEGVTWAADRFLLTPIPTVDAPYKNSPLSLHPTDNAIRAGVADFLSRFCRCYPVDGQEMALTSAALKLEALPSGGMLILSTEDGNGGHRSFRLWTEPGRMEIHPAYRLETQPYTPDASGQATWVHDENGLPVRAELDGKALLTVTYDAQGRPVEVIDHADEVDTMTYTLGYDRYGNLYCVRACPTYNTSAETVYTLYYRAADTGWVLDTCAVDRNLMAGF